MTNSDRVMAFIDAWNRLDRDAILAMMAPGIVYHNIPMPVLTGIDAVKAFFGSMEAEAAEWIVHHIAESGDGAVLTERTDRFLIKGKWIAVRVMGTFEFENGLITQWRDYFDLAEFTSQLA